MKTDVFTMEAFSKDDVGRAILANAHTNRAWHIVQRLAPTTSEDDKNGAYLIMLLDWPNGIITRMIFNQEECESFSNAVKNLAGMGIFDAFEMEGVVPV